MLFRSKVMVLFIFIYINLYFGLFYLMYLVLLTNLLSQEELGKDVYKLLTFLASKDKLKQMLDDFANSNLTSTLLIGDENPIYDLKNTVTAIAKFRYNNAQIATLGMLGSLRIDYESVLPRVEYIINTVSQLLKQGGVNFEQK